MQTARRSNENMRRVEWSNAMPWAHNGGGERDACTHMSVSCRGEVCWVYAIFETVMGWSRELIGRSISIWEFHSVSGVCLLGGAPATGAGPVRYLARYFVYEVMAIVAPRALQRVPCRACWEFATGLACRLPLVLVLVLVR
jgi:hypothetical protein